MEADMAAVVPTRPPPREQESQKQVQPEKVFGADDFELLVSRTVRRHITQQLCEPNHPVLLSEDTLIEESTFKVVRHLEATESEWNNLAFRLRKIAIVRHLRELAKERLRDHVETQDLDEEIAQRALETIMTLDFESIFPKAWVDG